MSGKSGVAMDEEWKSFRSLNSVVELVLLGAHLAEHDRIDNLKVRRIWAQREMNGVAVEFAV